MYKLIEFGSRKNMEVKKADAVVTGRYKLNPISLKFITILIATLDRTDKYDQIYRFKVKDFKDLLNLKRKDLHFALKESVKELLEKPLYIPKPKIKDDKNDNSFLMLNWLSSAEYMEGEGIIEFEISSKLRPYLLEAKEKFLKYKLENILSLKSSYSIRLYENLKDNFNQNTKYNKKAELKFSLEELRKMLQIPKSYPYGGTSGVKFRILEKSKKEFEEHTDIIFDYEEIKIGRKVIYLKFLIYPNPAKFEDDTNKKFDKYFKSRGGFVAFLRKNYTGNGKMFGYKTIDKRNYWLGINNKNLVYAFLDNETRNFNGIESGKIYDIWFKIAQNSNLYKDFLINGVCLQELNKENKDLAIKLDYEIKLLQEQGII